MFVLVVFLTFPCKTVEYLIVFLCVCGSPSIPLICILCTCFVGYAGRTELPDNLKSMFRPISMVVPDSTLIAEISLFAEGFSNCKVHTHTLISASFLTLNI